MQRGLYIYIFMHPNTQLESAAVAGTELHENENKPLEAPHFLESWLHPRTPEGEGQGAGAGSGTGPGRRAGVGRMSERGRSPVQREWPQHHAAPLLAFVVCSHGSACTAHVNVVPLQVAVGFFVLHRGL